MTTDEQGRLSELRRQSADALDWIANLPDDHRKTPSVCWNIGWYDASKPVDDHVVLATAQALSHDLRQIDALFLEPPVELHGVGGEIIERLVPSPEWLETRLAVLPAILKRHGLRIDGWAYEPVGCRAFEGRIPQAWCYRETDSNAQTH